MKILILLYIVAQIHTIGGCSDQNEGENVYAISSSIENQTSSLIEKIQKLKNMMSGLNREDESSSSKKFWIAGEIETAPKPAKTNNHQNISSSVVEGCCVPKPSSCADIQGLVKDKKSGIYTIFPKRFQFHEVNHIDVYCDLETDGGEWTVIQRRDDFGLPRENFTRGWADYKKGFGNLTKEFWLGNDIINVLTNQENVVLRIDMESVESEKRYVEYDLFRIKREQQKYQLSVGAYRGDAGDSLTAHNNMFFSTIDADNDVYEQNCAKQFKGAWWYTKCHTSNLNGFYYLGKHESFADGVNWQPWKEYYYSLKKVEMKIRPT